MTAALSCYYLAQPGGEVVKERLFVLFLVGVAFALSGCATYTLNNQQLWYKINVPTTWKPNASAVIESKKGDTLEISRVRDDGSLESVVRSRRKAFQISMTGFVIESEKWLKVGGFKAWQLIGTERKKSDEVVHVKVIIDAKDYKYFLEFRTPSESYRKKRKIIRAIVRSMSIKIPEY